MRFYLRCYILYLKEYNIEYNIGRFETAPHPTTKESFFCINKLI